jgi:hypothetical protein
MGLISAAGGAAKKRSNTPHPAIVDADLREQVQAELEREPAPLQGKLMLGMQSSAA